MQPPVPDNFIPEGVVAGFSGKVAVVVVGIFVGRGLGCGLGLSKTVLCSHLTLKAWLQQLQLGSNLSPFAQFLTTGLVSVQRRKVLHFGSAGFGATEPEGQLFSEK